MSAIREPFYVRLGEHVRDLREAQDMTQQELAFVLGLTRASISNIEGGQQRVLAHQIEPMAIALGVTIARLLRGLT